MEEPHGESFVVRIWREKGQPGWRGSVQQVRTGKSVPFQSLDRLLAFLERQIAGLSQTPRGGLK